jgi:hypothetical protein
MLIAFGCTLTALPAFIALCRPLPEAGEIGFVWARAADAAVQRHRWPILAGAACLALLGLGSLPWLKFDGDPLHTKNQHTEAVRTLDDLRSSPLTNPYTIDALMPSLAAARAMGDRLATLPLVADAISLNSFVPADRQARHDRRCQQHSRTHPGIARASPGALGRRLAASRRGARREAPCGHGQAAAAWQPGRHRRGSGPVEDRR